MSAPAINLTALIELERAAEGMDYSFSAVEQTKGYRAALADFNRRKRRLRAALADFKDNGFARVPYP